MACRSGCKDQNCGSYGQCLKNANLRIAYCGIGGLDATAQRVWDQELNLYRSAVSDGLEPRGTTTSAVRSAYAEAEAE